MFKRRLEEMKKHRDRTYWHLDETITVTKAVKEGPFTNLFKAAALQMRSNIRKMTARLPNSRNRKLVVFHFRGTDRPCVLDLFSPQKMIDKLVEFGFHKHNVTLYLMTNVNSTYDHVIQIRKFYSPFFFEARDFLSIFNQKPFVSSGSLVFTAEMQLQQISDGFVVTFAHHFDGHSKRMGFFTDKTKCI